MSDIQIQIKQSSQPTAVTKTASAGKVADSGFSKLFNSAVNSNTAKKTTDMDDIFTRASAKYGVPVNLLKAIAKAESGFDPNAVSSCGAQGVMQLMPSTAASMGVQNPLDAEQNIMAGANYISQKISQYNGDVKLALAAYNAGSGNVAKYGGIPPFKETQTYVARVMNYAGMSLDAPETSSFSGLSGALSSQNTAGSSDSLNTLNALAALAGGTGGTSGLTALSSLLNKTSSTSTQNKTFSYEDYLSFLQLWISQMQTGVTQSLTASIGDLTRDSSTSDLSGLSGFSTDSAGISDLSGLSSSLSGMSALAGPSSDYSPSAASDYKNSTSLLY